MFIQLCIDYWIDKDSNSSSYLSRTVKTVFPICLAVNGCRIYTFTLIMTYLEKQVKQEEKLVGGAPPLVGFQTVSQLE